ncbi:MAG: hypothetical protein JO316_07090 [Abitibacteriaceae bacterium]|nr:hypothetical protein [Abditibacteriaceae bacterium]
MNNDQFEAKMRQAEYFHELRLVPGAWVVIRVDGRGFSRFTEKHFQKPCDERFRDYMLQTAQVLLEELTGLYVYTESDEISILIKPNWNLFDRGWEKAVSISAGIASAAFTHACGKVAHFDSRVWLGVNEDAVVDYFRWRQSDAQRCALNGWCYWTLRNTGVNVRQATKRIEKLSVAAKQELLLEYGITFNELPAWQRQGVGLYWEEYEKEGYNPQTDETVKVLRRRVKVDWELPVQQDYKNLLLNFMRASNLV